jgi:hypothetical protein
VEGLVLAMAVEISDYDVHDVQLVAWLHCLCCCHGRTYDPHVHAVAFYSAAVYQKGVQAAENYAGPRKTVWQLRSTLNPLYQIYQTLLLAKYREEEQVTLAFLLGAVTWKADG